MFDLIVLDYNFVIQRIDTSTLCAISLMENDLLFLYFNQI